MILLLIGLGLLLGALQGRALEADLTVDVGVLLRRCKYLYLLVPLAVLGFVLDFVLGFFPEVQWRLPLWLLIWYVPLTRGLVMFVFGLVVGLTVMASARGGRSHAWAWGLAALLALAPLPLIHWHMSRPIEVEGARVGPEGLIMQSSGSTCVPAAAANVARSLGISTTEREMIAAMGTTVRGTTVAQLAVGLQPVGLRCRIDNTDDLRAVKAPAVLFVHLGSIGHAVAFMGIRPDGRAEIWDPMRGKRLMTEQELHVMWPGNAVEVYR